MITGCSSGARLLLFNVAWNTEEFSPVFTGSCVVRWTEF